MKNHHPDACRDGTRNVLTMGFSRRAPGDAAIAPEGGDDHERMASGSLPHDPSPTGMDPHIGASASLETALSRRIWQHSLPHTTATTPTTEIAKRFGAIVSMNFRAFADQVDKLVVMEAALQDRPKDTDPRWITVFPSPFPSTIFPFFHEEPDPTTYPG